MYCQPKKKKQKDKGKNENMKRMLIMFHFDVKETCHMCLPPTPIKFYVLVELTDRPPTLLMKHNVDCHGYTKQNNYLQ